MQAFLISIITSFISTFLIIRSQSLHATLTHDYEGSGPQKIHSKSVPRIGGLAIILGLISALLFRLFKSPEPQIELYLILSVLPVFLIGFLEDITKKISVWVRFLIVSLAALISIYLLQAQITTIDIPGVNYLFLLPGFALCFSIFAITGLANAYNIIDGLNGLSSMVGIISLIAIAYINFLVGDLIFFSISITLIGSILGFLLWNYPRGSIFMGDGGSYLIGFLIALLSILLVARNSTVSPWFALMVSAYPIIETLFTIYRRVIHHGKSPGQADGMHFHSLLYRRVFKSKYDEANKNLANSKTSIYLWCLSGIPVIAAILFWNSTPLLVVAFFLFVMMYIWLYQRIVRFKTPNYFHYF